MFLRDVVGAVPYGFKLKFDVTARGAARTTFCEANPRDAPHGVAIATLALRVANVLKDVLDALRVANVLNSQFIFNSYYARWARTNKKSRLGGCR